MFRIDYAELASTLSSLRKETEALKRITKKEKTMLPTVEEELRRKEGYSSDDDDDDKKGGQELPRKHK